MSTLNNMHYTFARILQLLYEEKSHAPVKPKLLGEIKLKVRTYIWKTTIFCVVKTQKGNSET